MDVRVDNATENAKKQFDTICELIDGRETNGDFLTKVILTYVYIAMDNHESICILVEREKYVSASSLSRPLVEASIRAMWLSLNENNKLVTYAINQLEKGKDKFPTFKIMFDMIDEHSDEDKLTLGTRKEIKALHSYAHGGHFMISRCMTEDTIGTNFSSDEVIGMLRGATYYMLLTLLAFASKVGDKELADKINKDIKSYLSLSFLNIRWSCSKPAGYTC
ncbi:DUF6988 family protein [Sulfurimonas sp. CS5]|uniref:DUF6988 family protein n=1 Tax=Sulfurimonas sp. CS5 TaxID=3391145 RepID=UPI0039EB13B0